MTLLGWIIFIFALLFSIMLHEFGHFVTAKKFHMKVTQFFVGFGQTLWSTVRGETEYGIKALPAGGFVKIVGMTALEDVDPADEDRSFRHQPGWQRMIVLGAGSFMHFLLAFVLLFILAVGIGLANSSSATVGAIDPCVPKSETAATCVKSDPASPAAKSGLRTGDKVVALAGQPVHNWNQLGKAIRAQPAGTPVTVIVLRDGHRLTLHPSLATIHGRKGSYLGISPAIVYQTVGPISAVRYAGTEFGTIVTGSVSALGSIPKAIPDLFAKNRSSTAGGNVTSVVGAGEYTGQAFAAQVGWQTKVTVVLLIVISLNIFVGLFNLLPLLPLDGGHLAVVIYESIRSWIARLLRRPDPGLVDMRKLLPVSVGVFALLVGFGLLLILADLVNPVHIPQ
ncbi:MAG TPA: site-2 protease family protein [Streptosporangiaceae bacterium]|jgi:membrane-associated protease RseP (regulator of RpoE activity)